MSADIGGLLGPAEQLTGLKLLDRWLVQGRIRRDPDIYGESRSCCYRAVDDQGVVAFVKASDFRREELDRGTDALERMVREYNHERDVHYLVRDRRVSRVTRIFGADRVVVNGEVVHFIVCEWATDCLRERQPPGDQNIALHERFVALRNAAAAMAQLHSVGVAHQDVKPSNAMVVDIDSSELKLTDLGSSSCLSMTAPPHDSDALVGQPNYAPYELLYGQIENDWQVRRFGTDLFLLGNLCFTSIVGGSLTVAALHWIPETLRHTNEQVRYSDVLPHLVEAHQILVPSLLDSFVPTELLDSLSELVLCLCHPDPTKRGHPKNVLSDGHQFGLERVISKFASLATKARILSRGKN